MYITVLKNETATMFFLKKTFSSCILKYRSHTIHIKENLFELCTKLIGKKIEYYYYNYFITRIFKFEEKM